MTPIKLKINTKSGSYKIIIGSNIIKDLQKYLNNDSIKINKLYFI